MPEADTLPDLSADGSSEELRARVAELEQRVRQAEERRRALLHIMGDLHDSNKRLGEQRKAMLHILKDSHRSNLRLEDSRKAMIHIMGDLRETTAEMERRGAALADGTHGLLGDVGQTARLVARRGVGRAVHAAPSRSSRALTSGCASTCCTPAFTRAMASRGVPAGAMIPQ